MNSFFLSSSMKTQGRG